MLPFHETMLGLKRSQVSTTGQLTLVMIRSGDQWLKADELTSEASPQNCRERPRGTLLPLKAATVDREDVPQGQSSCLAQR